MNDDELNRRLAELRGYQWHKVTRVTGTSFWVLTSPDSHVPKSFRAIGLSVEPCTIPPEDATDLDTQGVPRYCADLNETAKVEATLTEEQWDRYTEHLINNEGLMAFTLQRMVREMVAMKPTPKVKALIATLTP